MTDHLAGEERLIGYLFTDIDASLEKWERTPGEMRRAQARHDALIGDLVAAHAGVVQDRAGDGVFAMFPGGDPLRCALQIQLAMQAEDWSGVGGLSVRIGVHCGPPAPDGPDKIAINRAARIMASCWGGQIGVSEAAARAYGAPPGADLIDLGVYRLRGVETPMRLMGLTHEKLALREFPPLRGVLSYNPTLPARLAPLLGRSDELADISARLTGDVRQLAIVGPGGNGKTRLALEVAALAAAARPAYFVPLETASTAAEMTVAIAAALRLPLRGDAAPEQQITEYLRGKDALVVLDNADRLVGQCAFLGRLLADCAELRLLITSREPLGLEGETVYRLGGLKAPAQHRGPFRAAPACQLFVQKAQAASPGFELSDADRTPFAEICALVGGSPLALGLTAQWTRLLSLHEICERLRQGLGLLAAAADEHVQRTWRSVFDSSWALLTSAQRDALIRLSVFRDGFSVQAAELAAGVDVAVLAQLERKCLLEPRKHRRLAMHPLIREFAREKLAAAPAGVQQEARARHSAYFLDFVVDSFAQAKGAAQPRMLDRIERDLANLRAAFAHAVAAGDLERIRRAREPIFYALVLRALFHDCIALFDVETDDAPLRRYCQSVRANCLLHQGSFDACAELARQALEHADESVTLGHCHHALGAVAHVRGAYPAARESYERALAERLGAEDGMGSYYTLTSLAFLELVADNVAQAGEWMRQCYRLCQRIGHLGGMLALHVTAGDIAAKDGRPEDMLASYRKALQVEEAVGHPQMRALALLKLAGALSGQGQHLQACERYEEALDIARLLGDVRVEINAAIGLARSRRLRRELGDARRALQAALAQARALSSRPQLATSLIELAHVEMAAEDSAAAARAARLARQIDFPPLRQEAETLMRALPVEEGWRWSEGDWDTALLEIINEPQFGVVPHHGGRRDA